MRKIGLLLLLTVTACDKQQAEELPTVSAMRADAVDPHLGGTVVVAGNHLVELRPERSGAVEAMVYDAKGKALGADADLKLQATVQTASGKPATLPLAWEPKTARYHGELDPKQGAIAPGPARVQVQVDDTVHEGNAPTLAVLPTPRHGGTLMAAGDYTAELVPRDNGEVYAYVHGLDGKPVRGNTGASFHANLHTAKGTAHRVDLRWDKPRKRWVGRAPKNVTLRSGPIMFVAVPPHHAPMRGSVDVIAIAPAPRIDGSVVLVGDHAVEVHKVGPNEVEAVVVAPNGAVVRDPKAEITLDVRVSPTVVRPVVMVWQPARTRYVGSLHADVTWGAPFHVRLNRRRHVYYGAVYEAPAIAPPTVVTRFEAGLHHHTYVDARTHVVGYGRVGPHASFSATVVAPPPPRVHVQVKHPHRHAPRGHVGIHASAHHTVGHPRPRVRRHHGRTHHGHHRVRVHHGGHLHVGHGKHHKGGKHHYKGGKGRKHHYKGGKGRKHHHKGGKGGKRHKRR